MEHILIFLEYSLTPYISETHYTLYLRLAVAFPGTSET